MRNLGPYAPLPSSPALQMWAEKEMRNLARLHTAGILCPKPIQLRLHVLGEWQAGLGWAGVGWGLECWNMQPCLAAPAVLDLLTHSRHTPTLTPP